MRKRCRQADLMTPYERLKGPEGAAGCLRGGMEMARLEGEAPAETDPEAGRRLQEARADSFQEIRSAA